MSNLRTRTVVTDTDKDTKGRHRCSRCKGTGIYARAWARDGDSGGQRPAPYTTTGVCFRCNGKGRHSRKDRARNYWVDRHALARAVAEMFGLSAA